MSFAMRLEFPSEHNYRLMDLQMHDRLGGIDVDLIWNDSGI
jgi:hypothetical protein